MKLKKKVTYAKEINSGDYVMDIMIQINRVMQQVKTLEITKLNLIFCLLGYNVMTSWRSHLGRGESRHPESRVDQRNLSFQKHLHIVSCAPVNWKDARPGQGQREVYLPQQSWDILEEISTTSEKICETDRRVDPRRPDERGREQR